MNFILTGFTQQLGYRVFAFEGVTSDHVRTNFRVRADLGLIQRYGIRIQELPLMCRSLLERNSESTETGGLTLTEAAMDAWAKEIKAAKTLAAGKRKAPRRPTSENNGLAWRGPQPATSSF